MPFDITAFNPVVILDLADSSNVANDLELTCAHSEARPGFVYHVWLTIKNLSPYFAGSPNLVVTYDPLLSFLSSSYPLYTLSTGQIDWAGMYFLPGFDTRVIHLQFQVPPDPGLIGTQLSYTGFVQQYPLEADESNNTCSETITIVGSLDPNDKTAFTSSRLSTTSYYLDEDTSITYVIRFQNTGTASAIDVVITDTLPQTLDLATLQVLGWSRQPDAISIGPGQLVTWTFANINLPDSGANEAGSHGFVSFRIKPRDPLLPGTYIVNGANIYFDFNPPVITEPSVLLAEFSTGGQGQVQGQEQLRVFPNPAEQSITLSTMEQMKAVDLFAMDGRLVRQLAISGTSATLDIADLPAGIWSVRVHLIDGSSLHSRFSKH